jgi:Cu(I)/Ag(I) efflux system membrane fusion protein
MSLRRAITAAAVVVLVGAAGLAGYLLARHGTAPATEAGAKPERKVLYYRNPMNPAITSDHPMKDSMGMPYIPVYAGEAEQPSIVRIDPAVAQNLGVRTAVAKQTALPRRVDTVAYIAFDESLTRRVHARAAGWVQTLAVASEGETVRAGEQLFTLFSPEAVTAEGEFLSALASGNQHLIEASKIRLAALGVPNATVQRITRARKVLRELPYFAPTAGIVEALGVRPGSYVEPGTEIMRLGSLRDVWLTADVMEAQAGWIASGTPMRVNVPALPGRTFSAKVDFIYPQLNETTRTLRVRATLPNPDGALKPHMFANATLLGAPVANAVTIPLQALIRTGKEDRVVVALGHGRFKVREVTPGITSGERVQIMKGIAAGDRVVVSGQFLIDSEANIEAASQRLNGGKQP